MKSIIFLAVLTILQSLSVHGVVEKDYYQILGVGRTATDSQIKRAYKKLSLKWHPDRNKGNYDEARQMFVDISNAYDTLSDPEKRRIYNTQGVKGVQDHEQSKQQNEQMFRDPWGMSS